MAPEQKNKTKSKTYSYKDQQRMLALEKADELTDGMPRFMREFEQSCKRNNEARTVLGYMQDLDIFFTYLETELGTPRTEVTLEYLENLSPIAINNYLNWLSRYRKDDVIRENGKSASNRKMIALHKLYDFLTRLEYIQKNPAAKVLLLNTKEERRSRDIVTLDGDEIGRLLLAASTGFGLTPEQERASRSMRLRDTAILTLMLHTGVRVSECVGLDTGDVNFEKNTIRIVRKGHQKADYLIFDEAVREALLEYLENERKESETDPGALFISRKGQRLTVRSVQRLTKRYAEAAAIYDKDVHCHTLRKSYGTRLFAVSDAKTVQARLGHTSPTTSLSYYIDEDTEKIERFSKMDIYDSGNDDSQM